jgi:hypothetical protein
MIRTTFTASALAAMVMLAGCVTVNETYTGVTNESKREYLEYAGGKTPVLVRAVNSPFSEGEIPTATIAAKHAKAAVNPSQVAFTASDAAASQPHFRVVMVFDPAITVSAHDVCKADVAPLVAERTQEPGRPGLCENGPHGLREHVPDQRPGRPERAARADLVQSGSKFRLPAELGRGFLTRVCMAVGACPRRPSLADRALRDARYANSSG